MYYCISRVQQYVFLTVVVLAASCPPTAAFLSGRYSIARDQDPDLWATGSYGDWDAVRDLEEYGYDAADKEQGRVQQEREILEILENERRKREMKKKREQTEDGSRLPSANQKASPGWDEFPGLDVDAEREDLKNVFLDAMEDYDPDKHKRPREYKRSDAKETTLQRIISQLKARKQQTEDDVNEEVTSDAEDSGSDVIEETETLRYDVTLDSQGQLTLHWDIDVILETVTFRLEAALGKNDLLGFGFSDYGESTDADVVVMWTDHQGQHRFQVGQGTVKPRIGSILNPLAGKFSEDTRKKGKGAKTGASHDSRRFYLSQYDWLKGSHMTKVV